MQKTFSYLIICLLIITQFCCRKSDGYNTVIDKDLTKPGPVSNVKVTNFNGGAYITYDLPKSENILYVQAKYKINDIASRETKSSYYSDTIMVNGFAKSQDYKVTLYTVSRANVSSDSVVITVHPDIPPYLLVYETINMQNTFGGVNIKATNLSKADVGIITVFPDARTKKLEIINQNYTNQNTISYSLRGYDTLPKQFGIYVTDKWGNVSDTLFQTIHPIFETMMNKSMFSQYVLPTDVPNYQNGLFNLSNLWDNNLGEFCYATQQPILPTSVKPNIWPAWTTFDMGQASKLSRYMLWNRLGGNNEFVYTSGAPQTWVLWGRADTPQDELMPSDSLSMPAVGQKTPGGWINLGIFHVPPKPSGLPNPQVTPEDINYWKAGFNFDFNVDLPKIRYIRFQCLETLGGTNNYFNMNEISIYGNPNL